jgi:hypothetical protein
MKGKYNQGQGKPKWKAPRGSTSNAQAQAIGRGEGAKEEAKGQEKPHEANGLKTLAMLLMTRHAMLQTKCHVTK